MGFIKRGEQVVQYSVNAPARNYLLFHEPLLDWIVDKINNQKDTGAWEEIFPLFKESDYPTSAWIALGAGKYTEWGEQNYLQPEDECLIIIYDERKHANGPDPATINRLLKDDENPDGMIYLHQ